LWTQAVLKQKLDYIHSNPVTAGICRYAEKYKYSSESFSQRKSIPQPPPESKNMRALNEALLILFLLLAEIS
jgi:hypothetical protein